VIEEDLATASLYVLSRMVPPRNKEGSQRRALFLIMAGSEGHTSFIRFAFPQAQ